jgi:hypothetical protein
VFEQAKTVHVLDRAGTVIGSVVSKSKIVKLFLCLLINHTRVEAGSNTSTVILRVVRGDEMGLKKAAP